MKGGALPASDAQRRMIYGAARKAGMDNDVLHARCYAVTGREHISDLTIQEAGRLIDSIMGKKSSRTRRYTDDPHPLNRASQGQINIILGLAKKLGWLEDGSKTRLHAFLRTRYQVERLDWLPPDTAIKVTEAMKAMVQGGRGERKNRK